MNPKVPGDLPDATDDAAHPLYTGGTAAQGYHICLLSLGPRRGDKAIKNLGGSDLQLGLKDLSHQIRGGGRRYPGGSRACGQHEGDETGLDVRVCNGRIQIFFEIVKMSGA